MSRLPYFFCILLYEFLFISFFHKLCIEYLSLILNKYKTIMILNIPQRVISVFMFLEIELGETWHHQLAHWIFMRICIELFYQNNVKLWNVVINFLTFHLILTEFSVFCLFIITLFIQINLIAAWRTTLSPPFNVPLINLSKLT